MDTSAKYNFRWKDLGDISLGRPNLGPFTQVAVYRLMQYTMRDILEKKIGAVEANKAFFDSGFLAGTEFCKNVLNRTLQFNDFVADLTDKLLHFGIGVLRVESANLDNFSFVLTVSEDLDCSGLPFYGVPVCDYDEGFIAGILNVYSGRNFNVKEIDCWGTGERTCRFSVKLAS
ncbi:MAG: 4-vinyl reductase [Bacteroidota bacterium]